MRITSSSIAKAILYAVALPIQLPGALMMSKQINNDKFQWYNLCAIVGSVNREPNPGAKGYPTLQNSKDYSAALEAGLGHNLDNSESSPQQMELPDATRGNGSIRSINHIIFMAQGGRSFDQYYGKLNDYRVAKGYAADVDGLPTSNQSPDSNKATAAFHLGSQCTGDPNSSWQSAHIAYNKDNPTSILPAMDGFALAAAAHTQENRLDEVGLPCAMGYFIDSDLPYYYFMASEFGTSDKWFSPVMSGTEPNRMYLIAATSQGRANPLSSGEQLTTKTIFELLQENGITWKIYVTDQLPGRTLVQSSYINMFTFGKEHPENIVPISQYFRDVENGNLPNVAMIEGGYETGRDESARTDPGIRSVRAGSYYVSTLVRTLTNSPSWKDTVFILTHDNFGGFYDHVPPQPAPQPDGIAPQDLSNADVIDDFTRTGYRVPLLVISPFTRKHYVSHSIADFTAILKFIETRFNLPALTERDAAQIDMTEFFDFKNVPWAAPPITPPAMGSSSGRIAPNLLAASGIRSQDVLALQSVTEEYLRARRLGDTIRYAREFAGPDLCAKINAAILDGPEMGVVVSTVGLDNDQSCQSDPFAGVAKPVLLVLGEVTITSSVGWSWPSSVHISGAGDASTIAFAPNEQIDNLLTAYGATNLELDHVKITGTANTARLVSINHSSHVKIHDNSISGAGYIPKGGPLGGIVINDSSKDVWVERNVFSHNGPASPSTSTNADIVNWVGSNSGVHVRGNQIYGGTATIPIAMFDCIDCDVIGNQVDQNNKSSGNNKDGYGILSYGTGKRRPKRIRIIGNKVSNTAGSGIYLAQNDDAVVRDNKIINSSQQQSDITLPSGGLALNECVGCTVENNLITKSGKDGIVVVPPLTNTTIQGNTVEFASQWGIQLRGAVSDVNVYRNLVKNSVGGIDVVSTSAITRTKIQRNVIDTTFRDGIFVISATNSDISHNRVRNYPATYFGIRVFSGASYSVRWNTVINAIPSGGIDLVGTSFQMSDNTVELGGAKK